MPHHIPAPPRGLLSDPRAGAETWPAFAFRLARAGNPNTLAIQALDGEGRNFGCVDIPNARVLAPLMDRGVVRLEAKLHARPRAYGERIGGLTQAPIRSYVNVYGPEAERISTGNLVQAKGMLLDAPHYADPAYGTYRSAHMAPMFVAQSSRYAAPISRTVVAQTGGDMQEDVNKLFDSLDKVMEWPEMEADSRITTPLIKHQKQGLYFMTAKEKERTFTGDEDEHLSLWRKRVNSGGATIYHHAITCYESSHKPTETRGGILADMMGLGKTLQILSLTMSTKELSEEFARTLLVRPPDAEMNGYLPSMNAKCTLLVSPLSTVSNWEEQIAAHIQPETLKYHIYHGPNRESDPKLLAENDLIITTYSVLAYEYRKHLASNGRCLSPIQKLKFFRIVLDGKLRISSSCLLVAISNLKQRRTRSANNTDSNLKPSLRLKPNVAGQ